MLISRISKNFLSTEAFVISTNFGDLDGDRYLKSYLHFKKIIIAHSQYVKTMYGTVQSCFTHTISE